MYIAAERGDLQQMKLMYADGYAFNTDIIKSVIQSGSIEALEWIVSLEDVHYQSITSEAYLYAARSGHVHVIEWLQKNYPEVQRHRHTMTEAVQYNQYDCLYHCHQQLGFPLNSDVMYFAACNNNLELIKYAHDHGIDWFTDMTLATSNKGNIELAKYLIAQGCQWTSEAINIAAMLGHYAFVRFAHENGCPWHEDTVLSLVRSRRYVDCCDDDDDMHDEDDDISEENEDFEDEFKQQQQRTETYFECLTYVSEHGCSINFEAMRQAALQDDVPTMQFLYHLGVPIDHKVVVEAVHSDSEQLNAFVYCLQSWNDLGNFWCDEYNCILYLIDVDRDPQYHRLFNLKNLESYPKLHDKLRQSRTFANMCMQYSSLYYSDILPSDVITHFLNKYFC